MKNGFVYLIGAGPGDPELITLKAIRAMEEADCIIYDYLANPAFVEKYTCEKIYVGKSGSDHTLTQDGINKLLIEKAKEGKVIARLKGGDPFIFGRGGEEAEELVDEGIPFAIVPGISSFYSAPAYAGIPITHRDHANALEVVTGHRRADASSGEDVNFPEYNDDRTFAFLMGVKNLPHISKSLIEQKNFPKDTPVAVISWGTRPEQQVVTGPLKDIAEIVKKGKITPPAITLVGSVVSLREKLRWFDNQPLFGKKIVVTRTRAQASKLTGKLSALGAAVIEFPTIEIKPIEDRSPLEDALKRINEYSWLFLTSQNAVNILFDTLFGLGLDARALGGVKIAVIGPATGDELKKYGISQDLTPKEYVAESLLDAVKDLDLSGKKVLLPCAEEARPTLTEGLQKLGAQVDRIHTYKTVTPENIDQGLMEKIQQADVVTFTSSSTATNFFALEPKTAAVCASIGPVTSKTIRACSHEPAIEASEYTIAGLVQAIVDYYKKS